MTRFVKELAVGERKLGPEEMIRARANLAGKRRDTWDVEENRALKAFLDGSRPTTMAILVRDHLPSR